MARVAALWRHPIKAHSVEAVERVALAPGRTVPWDRVWAIAHDAARIEPGAAGWVPCANFSRGARTPALMAVRAATDEASGRLRLSHPEREPLEIDPDAPADQARLIAWVTPLCDPGRARPAFVYRSNGRGLTDSDFPSVAILNRASLRALSQRLGQDLAMERFRGNVWLDGLAPWEEFGWIGRELRIGGATLAVRERITRCKATSASPATGRIDADTLGALEAGWGHRDFGVYGEVVAGGIVALGDTLAVGDLAPAGNGDGPAFA
ncbi:MOSC domain-containing protein [soil metagenome]